MRRNSYKRNRAHVIGLIGEGKRNEMREREKTMNLCGGLGNNFRINLGNLLCTCSKDESPAYYPPLPRTHVFHFTHLPLILVDIFLEWTDTSCIHDVWLFSGGNIEFTVSIKNLKWNTYSSLLYFSIDTEGNTARRERGSWNIFHTHLRTEWL